MSKRSISPAESIFATSAGVGVGAAKDVSRFDLRQGTVHVVRTTGTVQLEASNDGTNFIAVGSAVSADTMVVLTANYRYLRVRTTVATFAGSATLHAHELLY